VTVKVVKTTKKSASPKKFRKKSAPPKVSKVTSTPRKKGVTTDATPKKKDVVRMPEMVCVDMGLGHSVIVEVEDDIDKEELVLGADVVVMTEKEERRIASALQKQISIMHIYE